MYKTFKTFRVAFNFLRNNDNELLFLIENLNEYAKTDGEQYIVCCEQILNQLEMEQMYFEILETN